MPAAKGSSTSMATRPQFGIRWLFVLVFACATIALMGRVSGSVGAVSATIVLVLALRDILTRPELKRGPGPIILCCVVMIATLAAAYLTLVK